MPSPPIPRRFRGLHPGFPLIELLVAISIIAILIGILLPALSVARRRAQAIQCMSNTRQIVMALDPFATDRKGAYPIAAGVLAWDQTNNHTPPASLKNFGELPPWSQQVYENLDSRDVFTCPSYPGEAQTNHYFLSTRAAFVQHGVRAPVIRQWLKFPSLTVLAGESNRNDWDPNDADRDDYTLSAIEWDHEASANHWEPHHEGTMHLAFADGHAAPFKQFEPQSMTFRYRTMSDW